MVPDLSVSLPTTLPPRRHEDILRRRLLDLQRRPGPDAVREIRMLEESILREGLQDRELLTELLYAYRDAGAWEDMARLIRAFPSDLQQEPVVAQQLALALNRAGDHEGAQHELMELIDRGHHDSETYGLLGRSFKDQWRQTGDSRYLDLAIDAYRHGVEENPTDYYPGINLATLLAIKGDDASRAELDALLPRLRRTLFDHAATGKADYWQLATSLELAVLDGDLRAAADLVEPTVARAAAGWMTETTAANLKSLANMARIEAEPELWSIIDRLQSAGKGGGPT
jgi:hypothetical protein